MNIELQTPRLLITPISLLDLEEIHVLHSLPETDKFNTLGIPENLQQTEIIIKDWIGKNNNKENKNFTFKVELVETSSFIGLISLNLGKPKFKSGEVWYKFHSGYWNKGYATESLNKLLDFAFHKLKLHRVEAGCAVEILVASGL